jgi:hypothetical protein
VKGVYTSLPRNYARYTTAKKCSVVQDSVLEKHGIDIWELDTDMVKTALESFDSGAIESCLVLVHLLTQNQPITVRGAMYRGIGLLWPDNKSQSYRKCCRMILDMRRKGVIPYSWIVDGTRSSDKPSSWSGLADFAETVAIAYRKDLWERQEDYIHIFVEKDAMSGIIRPVTREYDVKLTPLRGFASETQLWEVAEELNQIDKPIYAYYLGDHDPAGLRIEEDLRSRLAEFCDSDIEWEQLAITDEDFANPDLLGFEVAKNDKPSKWQPYLDQFGDRCVEVDSIPAKEIRSRVRDAIESHIDQDAWQFLKDQEAREKIDVLTMVRNLGGSAAS